MVKKITHLKLSKTGGRLLREKCYNENIWYFRGINNFEIKINSKFSLFF